MWAKNWFPSSRDKQPAAAHSHPRDRSQSRVPPPVVPPIPSVIPNQPRQSPTNPWASSMYYNTHGRSRSGSGSDHPINYYPPFGHPAHAPPGFGHGPFVTHPHPGPGPRVPPQHPPNYPYPYTAPPHHHPHSHLSEWPSVAPPAVPPPPGWPPHHQSAHHPSTPWASTQNSGPPVIPSHPFPGGMPWPPVAQPPTGANHAHPRPMAGGPPYYELRTQNYPRQQSEQDASYYRPESRGRSRERDRSTSRHRPTSMHHIDTPQREPARPPSPDERDYDIKNEEALKTAIHNTWLARPYEHPTTLSILESPGSRHAPPLIPEGLNSPPLFPITPKPILRHPKPRPQQQQQQRRRPPSFEPRIQTPYQDPRHPNSPASPPPRSPTPPPSPSPPRSRFWGTSRQAAPPALIPLLKPISRQSPSSLDWVLWDTFFLAGEHTAPPGPTASSSSPKVPTTPLTIDKLYTPAFDPPLPADFLASITESDPLYIKSSSMDSSSPLSTALLVWGDIPVWKCAKPSSSSSSSRFSTRDAAPTPTRQLLVIDILTCIESWMFERIPRQDWRRFDRRTRERMMRAYERRTRYSRPPKTIRGRKVDLPVSPLPSGETPETLAGAYQGSGTDRDVGAGMRIDALCSNVRWDGLSVDAQFRNNRSMYLELRNVSLERFPEQRRRM